MSIAPRRLTQTIRRSVALSIPIAVLAGAALAAVAPAASASTGHDPFGKVDAVSAPSKSSVRFVGWASDPNSPARNLSIGAYVDGHWTAGMDTDSARPWDTAHRGAGPTPGFTLDVPVPAGAHTVCLAARSVGAGVATILRCVATPLGTTLGSGALAAHNPKGAISWVSAWSGTLHVVGWSDDPDMLSRRSTVAIYVDGSSAELLTTQRASASRSSSAGPYSSFDVEIPVASGAHTACAWSVNVGLGTGNTLLGCGTADTRGAAGTGAVSTPAVNRKILAEAITHRGQAYVWAAAGPKSFDCSGLVMYSYRKFGITTPRVSQDQFRAARRIPSSRAVPGDLVFWYDDTGDVFHVGIYVSPGRSFAAIDPAEGVNYQNLQWATHLSYGSFTHA